MLELIALLDYSIFLTTPTPFSKLLSMVCFLRYFTCLESISYFLFCYWHTWCQHQSLLPAVWFIQGTSTVNWMCSSSQPTLITIYSMYCFKNIGWSKMHFGPTRDIWSIVYFAISVIDHSVPYRKTWINLMQARNAIVFLYLFLFEHAFT